MRSFGIAIAIACALIASAQTRYTYDAGGHLTKADYGANGSVAYSYDAAGHLTGRAVASGTTTAGTISFVRTAFAPPSAGIAQNTWVEVHGTNLVPTSTPAGGVIWSTAPDFAQGRMPTNLNEIGVTINGKPGYIYFFCSAVTSSICAQDQINVLTPPDTTAGPVQVVVSNNGVSSPPFTVTMHSIVPVLFNFDGLHVVALHADNSIVGPASLYPGASTPAAAGEEISVYGSGFGIPSGATITAGSPSQSGTYQPLPACTIAGVAARVDFAGLVSPGLVQLNLSIPNSTASGDQPISCTIGGVQTPSGTVVPIK